MLGAAQIAKIAAGLDAAERTRVQMPLISQAHPGMTMADAYAVQKAWVAMKVARGRVVKGHKIGLTSRAMQMALNIDEPDSGVLLDDMFFADGGDVPTQRFIGLRIEAELAFVMKRELKGPGRSLADVLAATDYVTPALEILDTRVVRADPVTKRARNVLDTISDNAANAGIVVGGARASPGDIDMRWVGAICSLNGRVEETGLAAGVLGHPAHGIAWLANRMAENGGALQAGDVVLSGSFIRPIEVKKGDSIQADYGPLGTVSCRFA